jgi:hypothetical protein
MTPDKDDLYRQLLACSTPQQRAPQALRQRLRDAMAQAAGPSAAGISGASETAPAARSDPEASCSLTDALQRAEHPRTGVERRSWRRVMIHSRLARYGAATAAAIVVLAVVGLWPTAASKTQKAWWMGPPAACAQEVRSALSTINTASCRSRSIWIKADGTRVQLVPGYAKSYYAKGIRRSEIYSEQGALEEIRWNVEQDGKVTVTSIKPLERKYYISRNNPSGTGVDNRDPKESWQGMVADMDKAQRVLEPREVDGRTCVGFEVDGNVLGKVTGRDGKTIRHILRIWFDVNTKLPHLIETESDAQIQSTSTDVSDIKTQINTTDQIDFAPQPQDLFVPHVPDGYAKEPGSE